jgi:hypothetical protein
MGYGFGFGLNKHRFVRGGGNTAFIIEVDTSKAGSNSDQFQFTGAQGDYDVVAKQNGIVVQTFNDLSGEETITFSNGSGVYILEVNAKEVDCFNRITFNNEGDKLKLTDVKSWGNIVWDSFNLAFWGCSNCPFTATDAPNLSNVKLISSMFRFATIANPNVLDWNLSNVEKMELMFFGASSANPNVLDWDVSNVQNMNGLFRFAASSNPNARDWDVSSVTNMGNIFQGANLSVENLTACYENWSQLNLRQNVTFSAGTTKYNASGQAGRDILVNTYNWNITDGGQS